MRWHRERISGNKFAAGNMSIGLRAIDILFELDTLGSKFKSPGKEQRQRETDGQEKQNRLYDPIRRGKTVQSKFCDLCNQPGHNHIGDADPEDIPAFEFVKIGHNGLIVAVGGVHSARGLKHGPIRAIFPVSAQISSANYTRGSRSLKGR